MMRAALLSVAGAAAVCAAAVPAVLGMMGNTSFSHHIPVRVPVGASAPSLATDDRGGMSPTRSSSTSHEPAEPSGANSHRSERHSRTPESSEHGTPGTQDRRHPRGRGRGDGASRTSHNSGSGRGPGGDGSGGGRHGDDQSGHG
jgi:hypothetical protein